MIADAEGPEGPLLAFWSATMKSEFGASGSSAACAPFDGFELLSSVCEALAARCAVDTTSEACRMVRDYRVHGILHHVLDFFAGTRAFEEKGGPEPWPWEKVSVALSSAVLRLLHQLGHALAALPSSSQAAPDLPGVLQAGPDPPPRKVRGRGEKKFDQSASDRWEVPEDWSAAVPPDAADRMDRLVVPLQHSQSCFVCDVCVSEGYVTTAADKSPDLPEGVLMCEPCSYEPRYYHWRHEAAAHTLEEPEDLYGEALRRDRKESICLAAELAAVRSES